MTEQNLLLDAAQILRWELKFVLRIETSFQDTPGDHFFFVLRYKDRPLCDQLSELGLKDGDRVILWDQDCGAFEMEATLLFNYKHPMMFKTALWAKACKLP